MKYEWLGIIGSLIIIFAFTFTDERKIRIADGIGAAFFILYGAAIGSFSTILLNSVLIFVHITKLRK